MQYLLPLKTKQIEQSRLEGGKREEGGQRVKDAEAQAEAKVIDRQGGDGAAEFVVGMPRAQRIRVHGRWAGDAERMKSEAIVLKETSAC